ncbi:MAG: D-inositol-3-phosphate glycosyltransferase [Chloroflexi bacterium]|nr:MAG: D-inositol-3-phosphate glycosyltransferase [Chloroflexota bacterium]
MNIAMFSYHTCPLATLGGKDTGGMNVYVAELTRELGREGIHVDVFTRSQDEHVPHVIHSLGYGNRVVHIPAGPEVPLPKPELASYIPLFAEEIQRFAAEKGIQYDLIHSHYWMSGIAAEILKTVWNVPVLQMFHTLGLMKNRIAQSPEEMEGDYRINGERQVMRTADKIVAATQAEEAQLEFLYGVEAQKIVTIPPGVDIARFYPIPDDEAKEAIGHQGCPRLLLFVGRIEPLKGVDTLIRALALVRQSGILESECYSLAIIGGEPDAPSEVMSAEMARLQALCSELGIGDLVVFLGKRAQETLPYYYSAADILIMPSHYESFGMVALEAMACGTPVIASQVGGLAFLVQDGITGFVVPGGDPLALSKTLTRLIQQPELRERLGHQAAEYAKWYSWDKITTRIKAVYEELTGQPE